MPVLQVDGVGCGAVEVLMVVVVDDWFCMVLSILLDSACQLLLRSKPVCDLESVGEVLSNMQSLEDDGLLLKSCASKCIAEPWVSPCNLCSLE